MIKRAAPIKSTSERGYTMVMVLVLMALTAFVVREALKRTAASSTIIEKSRSLTADAVDVEGALNKVIAHMQAYSNWYAYLFSKDTFYTHFVRIDAPAYGEKDTTSTRVLTMLTTVDDGNVAFLNNDTSVFDSETFPVCVDPQDGSTYDLKGDLAAINFDTAKVRITLIGANPEDPAGDTPPTPTTDFKPIFRIDAMAGVDNGPHIYALVEGIPVLTEGEVVTDMLFRVRQITTSYR